jgi:hypothetical protein
MTAEESEVDVLDDLMRRGFVASFTPTSDGLQLVGSTRTLRPDELTIRAYRRFEGVSDPDDMSGYASPAVAAVLDRVRIQHRELEENSLSGRHR